MTMFGKILVFINLTLSLVFASWALAIFTQRVNWTDKNEGRVAKLREELNKWNGADGKSGPRPVAEARWLSALAEVRAAEDLRGKNKVWYTENLKSLEDGTGAKGDPVKRIVYANGEVQRDDSKPKLATVNDKQGKALEPRTGLARQQATLNEEIAKIQQEISVLREEAIKQTDQVREVFISIGRAAEARQGSVAEQRYLERVLYNVQVEADLLLDRQKELEARLNELKSARANLESP